MRRRWLLLALLAGLIVRLPGVAWGINWPDGFTSHHPDESTHVANANAIISPLAPQADPRYPRALGAIAAVPFLAWYAAHGQFGGPRIHIPWTIGVGRLVSLAFGLAAILIVFAIGRDALGDERSGLLAAWLLAFGGLHVTNSHFFVADVPAATLTLLAAWLIWRDLAMSAPNDDEALRWAAFATGAAIAFKLFVFAVPALAYATFARAPRPRRVVHALVFGAAGLTVSSLGFDTPVTFYRTLTDGIHAPHEFDRLRGAVIYALQLPSLVSLPLFLAGCAGTWLLVRRFIATERRRRLHAFMAFGTIPIAGAAFVLLKLDHFPRHWVFLIPWIALAGGWSLSRGLERLEHSGRHAAWLLGPVFAWMLVFVVDAERFFVFEPRNDALRWIRSHVPAGSSMYWNWHRAPPDYRNVRWLVEGEPDVLVIEMYEANQYISGVDWLDTYPSDPRLVFDGRTIERVTAMQSLFRGGSNYEAVARFPDSYVMPEFRLTHRLLGDRSRTPITEVVVFRRKIGEAPTYPAKGS